MWASGKSQSVSASVYSFVKCRSWTILGMGWWGIVLEPLGMVRKIVYVCLLVEGSE